MTACPICKNPLPAFRGEPIQCPACKHKFAAVAGSCDLLDLAPKAQVNDWQAHFDTRSEGAEDLPECSDHANQATFLSMQGALRAMLAGLRDGAVVLESGCGSGLLIEPWLKKFTVHGVDFSVPSLLKARKRGLQVLRATVTELPYIDESFDAVLSLGTAQYLDEIDELVKESARVLKPGGRFVLATLNSKSLIRQLRYTLKPGARKFVERLYSTSEVVGSCQDQNLELTQISYHFFPLSPFKLVRNPKAILDRLATNMLVCAEKKSRA